MKPSGNDKTQVFGGVSALMMLADIGQLHLRDSFEAFLEGKDALAQCLLQLGPQDAVIIVQIPCQLALHVAFFGFKLSIIELRAGNGKLLQVKDAVPLEISAGSDILHAQVASRGIMIGAVFGKLRLKRMLVFEPLVSSERHVLHKVRRLVNFGFFHEAVACPEVKLEAHDSRVRHVNQQATGAAF